MRDVKKALYLLMSCLALEARAANRVGDADNSGGVSVGDAALVQSRALGIVDEWSVSPLALADADGDIDLSDVLLIAQAANGLRTIVGPGGWLLLGPPSAIMVTSGDAPVLLQWSVLSNYVGVAEKTDGLTGLLELAPPSQSLFTPSSVSVSGFTADGQLTPINTTGAGVDFQAQLTLTITDSGSGGALNSVSMVSVTVQPSTCGNGWTQPGEGCDDGNLADDCVCLGNCTLPSCGDGMVCGGEACDTGGESATCDTDCTLAQCGDGIMNMLSGEFCDDAPYDPTYVGLGYLPFDLARDIAVSGNRAYVAHSSSGIQVLDITTTYPTVIGSYPTYGLSHSVEVSGNRAYVADAWGLMVLDISTLPPTLLGGSNTEPGVAQGVFVVSNRAYLANGSTGLFVLDIGVTPPVQLGSYNTPGTAVNVFVSGNRAYVADSAVGGLQVLNISVTPPTFVGSYNTPGDARGVYVSGTRAYVADGSAGLLVLDVTGATPTLIGSYNTPGNAYDVVVRGERAFLCDYLSFKVFDISQPTPFPLGSHSTFGTNTDFKILNNLAYITMGDLIEVVDITEQCGPGCNSPACGDWLINPGETCDDGNLTNGDGCNDTCTGP